MRRMYVPAKTLTQAQAQRACEGARDRERRAARVGLSDVHTSPRYWAECSTQGAYLAVRERGTRQTKPPDSRRGRVTSFSRRSRSRMMKLCSQINRDASASALCVTLTYPAEWPGAATQWKRHLDTFFKRLRRAYPRLSAIWKLEFQRRGAPHFHCLIYGQAFIPAAWIATQWYEVVGSNDERHLAAGTEVRRVRSYRQAVSYAAKYLGKPTDAGEADPHNGRYWGVLGRRALPYRVEQWRLGPRGAIRLARILRGLARSRGFRPREGGHYARWAVCRGDRARAVCEFVAFGLPLYQLAPG